MAVDRISQLVVKVKGISAIVVVSLLLNYLAGNSLHRCTDQFWSNSALVCQRLWVAVLAYFHQDESLVSIVGSTIYTMGIFWSLNLFLTVLDLTGRPAAILRYKIQPDKNCPLTHTDLWRAVKVAVFNQTIVGVPFLCGLHIMMKRRGCSWSPEELPTATQALLEMAVFVFVEEISFYYAHRMLHHPRLYKHIHKKHHEWTAPIGIVSIYAHPVEHIFANLLPPALGPILMGSHMATAWLWWGVAILSTTIDHGGYRLPWFLSPDFHDYHHLKFNTNYGVIGLLDRLHGTDALFRKHISGETEADLKENNMADTGSKMKIG
ncbi:unnamed protein product [Lymnaea stagnalis]|uniref:Fatty acid hydroxylase domain-containing protein n=1 Tax=Lymnaea stagnalis TaxID=6523 RepID=A0AAV2HAW6_LYMST